MLLLWHYSAFFHQIKHLTVYSSTLANPFALSVSVTTYVFSYIITLTEYHTFNIIKKRVKWDRPRVVVACYHQHAQRPQ